MHGPNRMCARLSRVLAGRIESACESLSLLAHSSRARLRSRPFIVLRHSLALCVTHINGESRLEYTTAHLDLFTSRVAKASLLAHAPLDRVG